MQTLPDAAINECTQNIRCFVANDYAAGAYATPDMAKQKTGSAPPSGECSCANAGLADSHLTLRAETDHTIEPQ